MAAGCAACEEWLTSAREALQTEVGRQLFAALAAAETTCWWQDLPRKP